MQTILSGKTLKTAPLNAYFVKCVKGYHWINDDPIKESTWEAINSQILKAAAFKLDYQSKGSHKPGADIYCEELGGGLSNKSAKYEKKRLGFKVSSYRLTTVCNETTPGTEESIIDAIEKRKNFQYYSILVRDEQATKIDYDWFLIPANEPALNPASYHWKPKYGKRECKKQTQVGWETECKLKNNGGTSMSIAFNMSSQLWIFVQLTDELREYKIGSCSVNLEERQMNYIQLFERFSLKEEEVVAEASAGSTGSTRSTANAADATDAADAASVDNRE
jgi:hypothetical protein